MFATVDLFYFIFAPMNKTKSNTHIYLLSLILTGCFLKPHLNYSQEKQSFIENITKKLLSSNSKNERAPSLLILPSFGYSQESGVEYGVGTVYNFFINKNNQQNKSSSIFASGTLTSKKQSNIKLESDIWTNDNDYHIMSEFRYQNWPFNFYGLGMNTWKEDKNIIGQKMGRIKLEVEKKIIDNFYIGLNSQYEHVKYSNKESQGVFETIEMPGKEGGQFLSLGTSLSLDYRNTNTYTTKGLYFRGKYAYAPNFWGKENFTGALYEADLRYFIPFSSKVAIASQALYRGTSGKKIPYYAYQELGGDSHMRGYYLGRYVDKNYLTAQVESRFRIHPRIGFTLFGGIGSTFSEKYSDRWVGNVGGGIRYFYSLSHNSTIRLDYAIGEKRPGESRQAGMYLSISEAF